MEVKRSTSRWKGGGALVKFKLGKLSQVLKEIAKKQIGH